MAATDPVVDLSGRVALVTGSARRVGRAILHRLAASGAKVVVNSRSDKAACDAVVAEIVRDHGAGTAMTCLADVGDEAAVERMVGEIVARFGGLDILVNNANARLHSEGKPSLAVWRATLQTTLDGAFLCSYAAAPYLGRSGAGRIINLGGVSAHVGSSNAPTVTAKMGW